MSDGISCESCTHYVFNEDYEEYECLISLDEDEYAEFISSGFKSCPYFRLDDEYGIVRKQM